MWFAPTPRRVKAWFYGTGSSAIGSLPKLSQMRRWLRKPASLIARYVYDTIGFHLPVLTRQQGTWYYMSVCCSTYPGRPVSIADELESFFHVLLYLAVRFLRTSSLNVRDFVDDYFEGFDLDDGRVTCGHVKEKIIQTGSLTWKKKLIRFLSAPLAADRGMQPQIDAEHLSPLNDVIAKYLAHFQARYAVLEYESQASTEEIKPLHSLQSAIEAATSSSAAAARLKDLRRARYQTMNLSVPSANSRLAMPPPDSNRPKKPAQSVYETAAKLETHDAILDILAMEVDTRDWPSDDYAGDQLLGYVPRQLQSTAKRARYHMWSTMESIPEGEALHSGHSAA